MGEIGISRHEFYYELRWWEVNAIVRGYNRRHRHLWSATRWQTFKLMEAQLGTKNLEKSGIHRPTDLMKFPWEKTTPIISDDEAAELQAELDAINAASKAKSKAESNSDGNASGNTSGNNE